MSDREFMDNTERDAIDGGDVEAHGLRPGEEQATDEEQGDEADVEGHAWQTGIAPTIEP